jgi:hypothetical protein
MRFVRMQNNVVVEIGEFDFNPTGVLFHPSLIWIAHDTAGIGDQILGDIFTPRVVIVPAPTLSDYILSVQSYIDSKARAKGYDSGLSCVSYVGDSNSQFDSEATQFKAWRSLVWLGCNNILSSVQSGARTAPQTIDDLINELPEAPW